MRPADPLTAEQKRAKKILILTALTLLGLAAIAILAAVGILQLVAPFALTLIFTAVALYAGYETVAPKAATTQRIGEDDVETVEDSHNFLERNKRLFFFPLLISSLFGISIALVGVSNAGVQGLLPLLGISMPPMAQSVMGALAAVNLWVFGIFMGAVVLYKLFNAIKQHIKEDGSFTTSLGHKRVKTAYLDFVLHLLFAASIISGLATLTVASATIFPVMLTTISAIIGAAIIVHKLITTPKPVKKQAMDDVAAIITEDGTTPDIGYEPEQKPLLQEERQQQPGTAAVTEDEADDKRPRCALQ